MDDTLLKYEQSLEALERQREELELVMNKMGAEWEESGAGIGWMGDILYKDAHTVTEPNNKLVNHTPPPLMSLMHSVTSSASEPSHDYLQTLLNVNDELLAKSLATTNNSPNIYNPQQDHHPQLLKSSPFSSQQMHMSNLLPLSPEDDSNSLITSSESNSTPHIVQFTPPITPD